MCGFVGFIGEPGALDAETLERLAARMADRLESRGPDDAGTWVSPSAGIALGHRRLAIIDLTAAGHLSLLFTPSGAETLVFWVSQPLAWLVAPKDVLLMTRRGDHKLSHGATAKARENAVKQDRVQTTNAIKSP